MSDLNVNKRAIFREADFAEFEYSAMFWNSRNQQQYIVASARTHLALRLQVAFVAHE